MPWAGRKPVSVGVFAQRLILYTGYLVCAQEQFFYFINYSCLPSRPAHNLCRQATGFFWFWFQGYFWSDHCSGPTPVPDRSRRLMLFDSFTAGLIMKSGNHFIEAAPRPWLLYTLVTLTLLLTHNARGQSPLMPPLWRFLDIWKFNDTNLLSGVGFPPRNASDAYIVPSFSDNAV